LVVGLDYADPFTDPHQLFNQFKQHPAIASLLEGGRMLHYGAKSLPEGGLLSQPKYFGDGFLMIGDTASFLNSQKLKGIHTAMRSGMLAAETIFEALLAQRFDDAQLSRFEKKVKASDLYRELYEVRNSHQAFRHGRLWGLFENGVQYATRGTGLWGDLTTEAGHEKMRQLHVFNRLPRHRGDYLQAEAPRQDNRLTFDKVTDVYRSGTAHSEDQPAHLKIIDPNICVDRCTVEYGNPCQYFCPAAVYEIEEVAGGRRPKINFSNCVHCKTCDIIDPYQIIDWVTPEGGGGPNYINL
ncbi:MAG: 4Fe-4S dicluster domain-containing protein, partial [Acidobacteriota bacterium]